VPAVDADAHDYKYGVSNFCSYKYVLDAGCWQGFFSNLLAENEFRVLGVDRSAKGVAAALARSDGRQA
jgi:2-polyprenyl-3-methyl-5-hydroxy-6-metoxy-1,4-benzoquinol methylase